jgi:hypothetical protein
MFHGTIDDLAVWNRILKKSELGLLFDRKVIARKANPVSNDNSRAGDASNAQILTVAKVAYLNPDNKAALQRLYTVTKQCDREANQDVLVAVAFGCSLHGIETTSRKVVAYLNDHFGNDIYQRIVNKSDINQPCQECHARGEIRRGCKRCRTTGICKAWKCKYGNSKNNQGQTTKCPECRGSGDCAACQGKGKRTEKCAECGGTRTAPNKRKLRSACQTTLELALNRLSVDKQFRFANGRQISLAAYEAIQEKQRRAAEKKAEQAKAEKRRQAQQAVQAKAIANLVQQQTENSIVLGDWVWRYLAQNYNIRGVELTGAVDASEHARFFRGQGNAYVTDGKGVRLRFAMTTRVDVLIYNVEYANRMGAVVVDTGHIYVGFSNRSAHASLLGVQALGLSLNGALTATKSLSEKMLGEAFDQLRR